MKVRSRHNEYALNEVFSFGTVIICPYNWLKVEDFWKMYNNTYTINELISNTDYLLFKKGIRPEWEDPHNN